jgi:hypothetical protein
MPARDFLMYAPLDKSCLFWDNHTNYPIMQQVC